MDNLSGFSGRDWEIMGMEMIARIRIEHDQNGKRSSA